MRISNILLLFLFIPFISCSNNNKNEDAASTQSDKINAVRDTIEIRDRQSFEIGGYRFIVEPSIKSDIPDFNKHHGIKISGGPRSYFNADAEGLALYLDNADTLELMNDSIKAEQYQFYAYLPIINHYLIKVLPPEGQSFLLVNRSNGNKVSLIGWPYVSTSKKHIIAVNHDLIAGHSANAFQLLKISNDSIINELIVDIKGWGPEKVKWVSDNSFIIEKNKAIIDSAKGKISNQKNYSLVSFKELHDK